MSQTIVLTGGGSAGHVTPNLALLPDLIKKGYDVQYIGTKEGIEHTLVTDIPYHCVEAGKLRRYLSKENISDIFKLFRGYKQAKKILKELSPALVFSKGGFVSVPVVWAAAKLKIPVVLHESDYTPGLANKLCVKKAKKICLTFNTAHSNSEKAVLTGTPIRTELFSGDKQKGLSLLGFSGEKPVLLIMGGSLGAQALNSIIDENLSELTQTYCVVHLRGKGNLNPNLTDAPCYKQYEYISKDIAHVFAATDLAVSRAGANAIFEFLALDIPALLIPLPASVSRGDQILNADYFKSKGYAHTLAQEDLNANSFFSALSDLNADKQNIIDNMKNSPDKNGTLNVLNVIYESVKNEN